MVTRVVYNNKAFKAVGSYGFKFSNNEVTFNEITIDFTGCTIADIPYKYQEIKIIEAENEENIMQGRVKFTGFLEDIDLSDMKLEEEEREITLTLLSPLKLATKRSVSLIGTYELDIAIKRVVQPLIDDGFILKELNIPQGQITVNFVLETIENCMNNIGFKRNIFWTINEKKEIYINSIDYLFGLQPVKVITKNIKEKGLSKIQPEIESEDYANVINFKNIRLIYSSLSNSRGSQYDEYPILKIPKTIKKGDIITFDNPIIVDEDTLKSYIQENQEEKNYYCINIQVRDTTDDDGQATKEYYIGINMNQNSENFGKFIKSNNISFSNNSGEEKEIVLQVDNFFSNLITGFKWNGDTATYITSIQSDTALRYTTMKFMYSAEIEKLKGIISKSGQIEKTIDYNNKWTTFTQLINYARSLMAQNSNVVNQVILEYDEDPILKLGEIVVINMADFYIQGKFTVKDINYIYNNELDKKWTITLKSTDLISSYIDLFRPIEKEENQKNIDTVILSEFIEEEINEVHSIELEKNDYTLDFNL